MATESGLASIGPAGIEIPEKMRDALKKALLQSDLLVLKWRMLRLIEEAKLWLQSDLLVLKWCSAFDLYALSLASIGPAGIEIWHTTSDAIAFDKASIGPAGIEMGQLPHAGSPAQLQSDLLVLKLGAVGEEMHLAVLLQSDLLVLKYEFHGLAKLREVGLQSDLLVLKWESCPPLLRRFARFNRTCWY